MRERMVAFIAAHPTGWDHGQWLNLLGELEGEGVDVSLPERVGRQLEEVRLAWVLEHLAVPGLGPKRVEALVQRFSTLWTLRRASAEEIAEIKTVPRTLAKNLVDALTLVA